MAYPPASPQPFDPARETPEPDEAETAEAISRTMLAISDRTYEDSGDALRSVHAKSHGLLRAELEIFADLPPVLAQGLFAAPARYPAVLRFSTIPGDILPDQVSTPRGLAIKIVGAPGARLPGSEGAVTQDFVLVNGPRFNAPSAKAFHANLKLLAPTTDRVEGLKKVASAVLQQVEGALEAAGGQSATLSALGGQQPRHILGETFFSQLALRHGDYIAKLSVTPESPELLALVEAKIDLRSDEDSIRAAVIDHFATKGGSWLVRIQLCTSLEDMPVDEATAVWSEAESPFIPVARLTVAPQRAWSEARSKAVDEGMGFSPWHGLADHQPLGPIMRIRKLAYDRSQAARSARASVPISEPSSLDAFPD